MTMLTKIGNSQGVRIPKPLIKQAHLEDVELEFEVVDGGLLIRPIKSAPRESWGANIEQTLAKHSTDKDEAIDEALLNDSDLEAYEW